MFPIEFYDWWYEPWRYAQSDSAGTSVLGKRDGYRSWCEQQGLVADIPLQCEVGWANAIPKSFEELTATARLFAGLFAASAQDQRTLSALSFSDMKWCVAIAAIQPMHACYCTPMEVGEQLEARGLVEVAVRLNRDFIGLWPRLSLMLAPGLATRVDAMLGMLSKEPECEESARLRVQRGWRICRNRARSSVAYTSGAGNARLPT